MKADDNDWCTDVLVQAAIDSADGARRHQLNDGRPGNWRATKGLRARRPGLDPQARQGRDWPGRFLDRHQHPGGHRHRVLGREEVPRRGVHLDPGCGQHDGHPLHRLRHLLVQPQHRHPQSGREQDGHCGRPHGRGHDQEREQHLHPLRQGRVSRRPPSASSSRRSATPRLWPPTTTSTPISPAPTVPATAARCSWRSSTPRARSGSPWSSSPRRSWRSSAPRRKPSLVPLARRSFPNALRAPSPSTLDGSAAAGRCPGRPSVP